MTKKMAKTQVRDEDVDLPIGLTNTQRDIDLINDTSGTESEEKHALSLVVNPDLIIRFEELLNRFKSKTKAYFTYSSKVQLFETGCYYLKDVMSNKSSYHSAPDKFIEYISRKGKRPVSDEYQERKGGSRSMYLTLEKKAFHIYYNLIYSFLLDRKDIGNEHYSSSYFFKDFIDILDSDFKGLCEYEKRNPRD